jgi:hypothetical protein
MNEKEYGEENPLHVYCCTSDRMALILDYSAIVLNLCMLYYCAKISVTKARISDGKEHVRNVTSERDKTVVF